METEPLQGTELEVHWEAEGLDLDFTLEVERPNQQPSPLPEKAEKPPVPTALQSIGTRVLDVLEELKARLHNTLHPPYEPHITLPVLTKVQQMRARIFALADESRELEAAHQPHGHVDHELRQAVVRYAKSSPTLKRRMVTALLSARSSDLIKAQPPLFSNQNLPRQNYHSNPKEFDKPGLQE